MTAPLLTPDERDAADAAPRAAAPTAEEVSEEATKEPAEGVAADARPAKRHAAPSDEPGTTDELPALEARDSIHLFAQSPRQLFLHWSHAADPFAALREAFADAAAHYRLAVRLSDLGDATEQLYEASPERAQWLAALPDRDYRADIGFHADGLPFVRLLSSAVVRTPRAAVSPNADAAPQFHITPADFSRLLEHTGYAPEQQTPNETTAHDERDPTASSYCHFSSGQWSAPGGEEGVGC